MSRAHARRDLFRPVVPLRRQAGQLDVVEPVRLQRRRATSRASAPQAMTRTFSGRRRATAARPSPLEGEGGLRSNPGEGDACRRAPRIRSSTLPRSPRNFFVAEMKDPEPGALEPGIAALIRSPPLRRRMNRAHRLQQPAWPQSTRSPRYRARSALHGGTSSRRAAWRAIRAIAPVRSGSPSRGVVAPRRFSPGESLRAPSCGFSPSPGLLRNPPSPSRGEGEVLHSATSPFSRVTPPTHPLPQGERARCSILRPLPLPGCSATHPLLKGRGQGAPSCGLSLSRVAPRPTLSSRGEGFQRATFSRKRNFRCQYGVSGRARKTTTPWEPPMPSARQRRHFHTPCRDRRRALPPAKTLSAGWAGICRKPARP